MEMHDESNFPSYPQFGGVPWFWRCSAVFWPGSGRERRGGGWAGGVLPWCPLDRYKIHQATHYWWVVR